MAKIRVTDLARELEVKSRAILDSLSAVGITEAKTHTSFVTEDEAVRVREHFKFKTTIVTSGFTQGIGLRPIQKVAAGRTPKPMVRQSLPRSEAVSQSSVADQHNNRSELLSVRARVEEEQRTRLALLATQPLPLQIAALGSLEEWRTQYRESNIPNRKLEQLDILKNLEERLRDERHRSEQSLEFSLRLADFPASKKKQYDQRLQGRHDHDPDWHECFVRLYTAAEWAFEKWAKTAGLECIDLNIANQYGPQDYTIAGRDIDVKATISVGGRGRREFKTHWSPGNLVETGEIICSITSDIGLLKEETSHHYIQGIFSAACYGETSQNLRHFKLDKNLLNACYFHSPDIFFGRIDVPPAPVIDEDVIDYCVSNRQYLSAIFSLGIRDAEPLLRRASPTLSDFIPVASKLMNRNAAYLLPHFLADYLMEKIIKKESMDTAAIENVIWSIYEPYEHQKKYLRALISVYDILPKVRCAHHPHERIEDMDIEISWKMGRPILRARCPTNRELSTTFLAYSWWTLETLIYDDPRGSVAVCDAPGCGCLTHTVRDYKTGELRRIGRIDCINYGKFSAGMGNPDQLGWRHSVASKNG